jgi:DNA-binding transcriptional MerR regulator
MATAELPNRSLFKAPEVCEIAQLQPYVLRSWEAEFPDLGVARGGVSGRVYRRHDVERVLRLKHLLFVEGLTLAGARRRLEEERAPLPAIEEEVATAAPAVKRGSNGAAVDAALRRHLSEVRQGLRSLLDMLDKRSAEQSSFQLQAPSAPQPERRSPKTKEAAKAQKSAPRRGHR